MESSEIRLHALELAHHVTGSTSVPALIAVARKFSNFMEAKDDPDDLLVEAAEESDRATHDEVMSSLGRIDAVIAAQNTSSQADLHKRADAILAANLLAETEEDRLARKERASRLATSMTIISNFAEFCRYVKITHPLLGEQVIRLFSYQEDMVAHVSKNQHTIINSARQMGKSTLLGVAYPLWAAMSQANANVLVVVPKHSREVMERIVAISNGLPLDLRPKITALNGREMTLANNSTIRVMDGCSPIGTLAPTHIILDEVAFVSHRCGRDLWSALAPFLAKACVIMVSTPSDTDGIFYHTWQNRSENNFSYMELPWHLHPERDEAWAVAYKGVLSGDQWQREFECKFIKK